jgi:hypothetical protein
LAGAFPAKPPPIWCCSIWPAHSPPSRHRFGVVPFGRRIPRQAATDLVLFHMAGAFPAEPPPIWCCSVWPAQSPPSHHRFGIVSLGRRIPRRFGLFVCQHICRQPTNLVLLHLAGASPRHTTIAHFGRRIPSLCHLCLSRLAHPIAHFLPAHPLAAPPLLFLAGASPRHATIAYLGWRIPLPCLHRLYWSAHPIAAPPYRISAGASHRRTSIAYLSVCALTRCRTARRNIKVVTFFTPAPPPHQY